MTLHEPMMMMKEVVGPDSEDLGKEDLSFGHFTERHWQTEILKIDENILTRSSLGNVLPLLVEEKW